MKTILVVEDNPVNMDLMIQLLEEDYHLIQAVDGSEALAMTANHRPDLVLMDMSLPVIDGYEATQRIKTDSQLSHIPVIGLSAHAMSGDAEKAVRAGCDAYLTKPIDFDQLFDALDRFLK
jgi:two-component system, cell cycle response regulator DivK